MDISSLTNLSLKTKKRDRLFHDKFEYSIEFPLIGAVCLRGLGTKRFNIDNLEKIFFGRRNLFNDAVNRMEAQREFIYRSAKQFNNIRNLERLQKVAKYMESYIEGPTPIKFMIRGNSMTLFVMNCNMLSEVSDWVQDIDDHEYVSKGIVVTQAVIDRPRNTIKRKKSDYSHRIHFRHVNCPINKFHGIQQFVKSYKDHISPSEGLNYFLKKGHWKHCTTESHFFIDVNDPKLLDVLRLAAPGVADAMSEIIVDK